MFNLSLESLAKRLDARFMLPRPANEQYLSSYRAFLRLWKDTSFAFIYWFCAFLSTACVLYAAYVLNVILFSPLGSLAATLVALAFTAAIIDTTNLRLPYAHIFQRETYGTGRWATPTALKALKMLTNRKVDPLPDAVPLAMFGWRYVLTLPLAILAEHVVYFGPPGSGKSASFFMHLGRSFSHVGGMIALDLKGELYNYSAHYFSNVYRFDLKQPEFSDRLDILGPCRGSGKRAGQVASYMIGYDANTQSGGENPFWPKAATLMLKCLILHLCTIMENPTPADIFDFIADHPNVQRGKETINQLALAMADSEDEDARSEWGATFSQLDPKTMSNVIVTMNAMLAPFRDPNVRDALRMPTEKERRRGCRIIDFRDLRKKGCAIYIVVPEGEASRLENVLATAFAIATDTLRETGDDADACYSLVMLDEAGNVPLRGLSEGVGVGRGRKIIYALGYQNLSQLIKQYGQATAHAILQSIGAKFFLPGLTGETAEWAVKMIGRTTALQRQSVDAVGNALDNEKLSEVGTELMPANELRQMLRFTQAVAVINNAPPARVAFPPNAKDVDTRISRPLAFADADDLDSTIPIAFARPSAVELPPEAIVAGEIEQAATDDDRDENNATAALLGAVKAEDNGNGAATNAAAPATTDTTEDEAGAMPQRDLPVESAPLSQDASAALVSLVGHGVPTVDTQPRPKILEKAVVATQTPGPFDQQGAGFSFAEFEKTHGRLSQSDGDILHIDGDTTERVEEDGEAFILEV